MKNLMFILIAFALVSASSCKKTYTCFCQNASNSNITSNPTVKAANASDATADCVALDGNGMSCTLM